MIHLTRINDADIVLNADLIETIEATPDTTIALTTGRRIMVREPIAEVVARVVAYHRAVLHGPSIEPDADGAGSDAGER